MNFFVSEIVTPPASLPITVADADKALAAAVVEECERVILLRAIVRQERKILISGPLPPFLELEPIVSIVSFTMWTPTDDAAVIDAASYDFISRDPSGTTIFTAPGKNWPAPERSIGSFALTFMGGWTVTATENNVPASVLLMIEKAVAFRQGGGGLAQLTTGAIKMDFPDNYQTDQLPPEIASIGRAFQYRPGLFASAPR